MLHELTGFLNKHFGKVDYREIENSEDIYLFNKSFTELYNELYRTKIQKDAATTELLFTHCGESELKGYQDSIERKIKNNPHREVALMYLIKQEQELFDKSVGKYLITKNVRNDIMLSDYKSLDQYWHQFKEVYYAMKMRHNIDRFNDFLFRVYDGILHAKRLIYLHHLAKPNEAIHLTAPLPQSIIVDADQNLPHSGTAIPEEVKAPIESTAPQFKTIVAGGDENRFFDMIQTSLKKHFIYDGKTLKSNTPYSDKTQFAAFYKALEDKGWLIKKVGKSSFKTFIQRFGFEREDKTLNTYMEKAKFAERCYNSYDEFLKIIPEYQSK